MPPRTTVIGWQRQIPEFSSQCARAREDGAQILETRIQKVAEKTEAGLIDPHAAKVAISAYQWRASKMNSRAYGEKAHHEHSGEVTLKQLVLQSMKPREED